MVLGVTGLLGVGQGGAGVRGVLVVRMVLLVGGQVCKKVGGPCRVRAGWLDYAKHHNHDYFGHD